MTAKSIFTTSDVQRFNRKFKVDKSGCWIWNGEIKHDYGRFSLRLGPKKKKIAAHRFSFIASFGNPPLDKNIIRHLCNNKLCVNPNHLMAGTHQDNMNDLKLANRSKKKNMNKDKTTEKNKTVNPYLLSRQKITWNDKLNEKLIRLAKQVIHGDLAAPPKHEFLEVFRAHADLPANMGSWTSLYAQLFKLRGENKLNLNTLHQEKELALLLSYLKKQGVRENEAYVAQKEQEEKAARKENKVEHAEKVLEAYISGDIDPQQVCTNVVHRLVLEGKYDEAFRFLKHGKVGK